MSAALSLSFRAGFLRSNRPVTSPSKTTILAFSPTVETRSPSSLYDVLRIKGTASRTEIKTAYRTLAKQFHPDAGSDGRDFIQICEAYTTLSDPALREAYDRSMGMHRMRIETHFPSGTGFRPRRWETDQCW